MRKYDFSIAKTVNRLMPHYLGGRKLILFLQGILYPLQPLQDKFATWAYEKRMEAAMTSQIILFTYFLNYKFRKYFVDKTQSISIDDGDINGLPMYWEIAGYPDNPVLRYEDELVGTEERAVLHYYGEQSETSSVSFVVRCPEIDTNIISLEEMRNMVAFWVARYKLAGKKFKIIIPNLQ